MELDFIGILKIVLLAIVVLVPVVFVLYNFLKPKNKRVQKLKKGADQAGFSFSPIGESDFLALLEDFNVLKHSEDEKAVNSFQAKNVVKGTINGFDFSLFDFTSEKYKQDQELSNQTVVYLELKNVSLPKFSLRPKTPSETTKNVFGAKPVK